MQSSSSSRAGALCVSEPPHLLPHLHNRLSAKLSQMVDEIQHQRMEGVQVAYPVRPGEPDCVYYLRHGQCGYGTKCCFNHPPLSSNIMQCADLANRQLPKRIGQPDCQYFMRTGVCNFGATCKYHHPRDRVGSQFQLNISGLPMGLQGYSSPVLMPGSPVYKLSAYSSSNGSAFFHGTPAYVMAPRASYLHSPQVPSPTSYTPVVLAPHLSPQWPYKGSYSPQTLVDGTEQITTKKNKTAYLKAESVVTYSKSTASAVGDDEFPEREGQPECQYYLRTGDCRFGALCKFHHPKARWTAQMLSANCALSVVGLPLRPGEPHCSYYMRYGVCKFGPVCKFDHPILVPLYK